MKTSKIFLKIVVTFVAILILSGIGLSVFVGILLRQAEGTCSVIHEFTRDGHNVLAISKCWFDDGFYTVYDVYRGEEHLVESAYVAFGSSYPEDLSLHYLTSEETSLAVLVAHDEPYDPLIIQDFSTGESWAIRGEGDRGILQKRFEDAYPQLRAAAQIRDANYLHSRWSLDLSYKTVEGADLVPLLQSQHITHLDLSHTGIVDRDMEIIGQLTFLTTLHLSGNAITDTGLSRLHKMTRLEELSLQDTSVTEAGIAYLRDCTALMIIMLPTDVHLSDTGLQFLGELQSLAELNLANARIIDNGLRHLSRLHNLKWLDLSGTAITDEGLQYVATLRNLANLNLRNCRHISDNGLKYLLSLPLRSLHLSGTSISDEGIQSLQHLTHLSNLSLRNTHITESGRQKLQAILSHVNINL